MEMPFTDRYAEAQGIKRFLSTQGGTVLVVGARRAQFPPEFRRNPRIQIWDALENHEHDNPPHNARVVIALRHISHATFARIHRFVKKRQALLVPGLHHTGEVKAVLSIALDLEPDAETRELLESYTPPEPEHPEPAPAASFDALFANPEPAPILADSPIQAVATDAAPADEVPASTEDSAVAKTTKRGALTEFIQIHADLDAASVADEARRLLPLAKKQGISPTHNSICQGIYVARVKRSRKPTSALAAPLRAKAPRKGASSNGATGNIGEALRLLDDVTAGLGLLREAVLKLQSDETKTASIMGSLQKLLQETGAVQH